MLKLENFIEVANDITIIFYEGLKGGMEKGEGERSVKIGEFYRGCQ